MGEKPERNKQKTVQYSTDFGGVYFKLLILILRPRLFREKEQLEQVGSSG